MLADRQRNGRTGFQAPRRRGLGGPLGLVLWVDTRPSGRRGLQRPSQDQLRDRAHPAPARPQGRAALHGLVAFAQPGGHRAPALEAGAEAVPAVGVAGAPPRGLPRPPRWPRLGDTGLPPSTVAGNQDGVCLTRARREVVAGVLAHALLAVQRAAPPAPGVGGRLALLVPDDAEPAVPPRRGAHAGPRRPAPGGGGAGPWR